MQIGAASPYNPGMFDLPFAPIAILYPLSALSDGCLLIAIALATTMGGRPLLWGACFALTHAAYSLLGVLALVRRDTDTRDM